MYIPGGLGGLDFGLDKGLLWVLSWVVVFAVFCEAEFGGLEAFNPTPLSSLQTVWAGSEEELGLPNKSLNRL